MANSMSTPIGSIPVKQVADENNEGDLNDPIVQNIINEMQKQKPDPKPHVTFNENGPEIQQLPAPIYIENKKEILDYDILKTVIILIVIVGIVSHPSITENIINTVPIQIIHDNSFIIKYFVMFLFFYLYFFYNK